MFSQEGVAMTLESINSLVVTICIVYAEEYLSEGDTTMMNCGHTFYNVCWTKHFLIKINNGQSKRINCIFPDCNVIFNEYIIRKLVTTKDLEVA